MAHFSDKRKKIAAFYLDDVYSVVKFSYVVYKSLTYLDLSLCELTRDKAVYEMAFPKEVLNSLRFACTEEDCKKRFARNRKLLYDLHLDVSSGLDLRFENTQPKNSLRYQSDGILLNKLGIASCLCEMLLNQMAFAALEETDEKVKVIHEICKVEKRISFIGKFGFIKKYGADVLYSKCWDSNIIGDFLVATDFGDGFILRLQPGVLQFLLYFASCTGYRLRDNRPRNDLISMAISQKKFKHVPPLLQYRSAPRFCASTYYDLLCKMQFDGVLRKKGVRRDFLEAPVENGLLSEKRNFWFVLIFYVFWTDSSAGFKALQLLWRSIPDAFISLDELLATYPELDGTRHIEEIHNFICDVTGKESFYPEPRKLQHYCRISIRNALSSNVKLFSGIDEIKLPPSLQALLKLEL